MLALASLLLQPDSTPPDLVPPTRVPSSITTGWTAQGELAVTWRLAKGADSGQVELIREGVAPSVAAAQAVSTPEEGASRWKAVLKATPGKRIWWRVVTASGKSPWGSAFIPAAKESPTDFLIFGDAQGKIASVCAPLFARAAQIGRYSEFSIHAGDLIDNNLSQKEWSQWLYAAQPLARQGPLLATPGNHEYGRPGPFKGLSPHWNSLFVQPQNGPKEAQNTSWHMNWSGVMVASLDCMQDHAKGDAWLRSLPWKKAKWRILVTHFPVYVTMKGQEKPGWTKQIESACKALGIQLVVTGHLHSYARSAEGRLPVTMVLNSGGKFYRQDSFPWMAKGIAKEQLFVLAQARRSGLTLTTYDVQGAVRDRLVVRP